MFLLFFCRWYLIYGDIFSFVKTIIRIFEMFKKFELHGDFDLQQGISFSEVKVATVKNIVFFCSVSFLFFTAAFSVNYSFYIKTVFHVFLQSFT